ncbi:hypothetical protein IV454_17770 [Massilia antarctica]|uniref:Uncharacterized protein n=1 Tax=Massilia antarctica TaxID=2765360 RepID=A0AA49A6A5_9BURK|nr:hypothetical protein [Massilia antarctica]QPI47462.1 hypothetical protein IV454_17770 [Massilia antarctica]
MQSIKMYAVFKGAASAMDVSYFVLWYKLNGADGYLVWTSGVEDGVLLDSAGRVPGFASEADVRRHADELGLELVDEEPTVHELDCVLAWIDDAGNTTVDCDKLLAAWNLFDDVSRSVGGSYDADKAATQGLYMKLFYGGDTANSVCRPEDEAVYCPVWSEEEPAVLRSTLRAGLSMFVNTLMPVPARRR